MMSIARLHISWLAVWLLLGAGCTKDPGTDVPVVPPAGEEDVYVTFDLRIPGLSDPGTRALSDLDENYIETIDVIAFHEDDTYAYRSYGHSIDDNTSGSAERTFTVSLRLSEAGEKYHFIFLANVRDEVDAAVGGFTAATTPKQQVLEGLLFESSVWQTTGASVRYLPMWGDFPTPIEVTEDLSHSKLTTSADPVYLMRSVARIDIGVNFDAGLQPQGLNNTFYIRSVSVYNNRPYARIAPDAANLEATAVGRKANAPTLAGSGTPNVLAYPSDAPYLGFVNQIYTGEALNSGSVSHADKTFLIVEGVYIEGGGTIDQGTSSYYRVDFVTRDENGTEKYLDLLRNHRYLLNIVAVDTPGYATAQEAASEPSMGLVHEIIVNEEGKTNYIVFNSRNMLGVNELTITLDGGAHTTTSQDNDLYIKTNYSGGWKIEAITDDAAGSIPSTWLTTDITSSTNSTSAVQVKLLADANQDPPREAYVHITAAGLSITVKVIQNPLESTGIPG